MCDSVLVMATIEETLLVLLKTLAAQETDIMMLKAHVITLESIAVQLAGADVQQQIAQGSQEQLDSKNFDAHRQVIRAIETAIVGLLPVSGVKN